MAPAQARNLFVRTRVAAAVCILAGMLAPGARAAPEPFTAGWIDAIWQDHLVHRGERVAGTGALEEAFFRDALRVEPRGVEAVEQLVHYYASTGESVPALGAALYGRLLDPGRPLWTDAVARAHAVIRQGAAAPGTNEPAAHAAYKAGLDAMLAAAQTNNFLFAEIEVRRLLTQFPRDPNLHENLCTFARLGGEHAIHAMRWLAYMELFPGNRLAANNLAAALESAQLPGPAHDALSPFLEGREDDTYLMGNAIRLAEAADRLERASALAARWRLKQPSVPEAWLASARVALRQQRPDMARSYWKELAQRIDADTAAALLREPPFAAHARELQEQAP